MSQNIKITFTLPNGKLPEKQHDTDTGLDLFIADIEQIDSNIYKINFGIAVEPPKGFYVKLYPRSSIYKYDCTMVNSVGIIDEGYRGSVCMVVENGDAKKLPKVGDRFGQIVLEKRWDANVVVSKDLTPTRRGAGGFGSTGGGSYSTIPGMPGSYPTAAVEQSMKNIQNAQFL